LINDFFTVEAPNTQITLDLLGVKWYSHIPVENSKTGDIPLFDDGRIQWLCEKVNVSGMKVLELGSFEGGHSFLLSKYGANVTGIESNSLSFMKSLIAEEILDHEAKFLYGDFLKYLDVSENYDLIVASGVLYHMENPVELLCRISEKTNKLFLWTHYFDPDLANWNLEVAERLGDKFAYDGDFSVHSNFSYPVVTQRYLESLQLKEFCGGPTEKSSWMFRNDIVDLLAKLGFDHLDVIMENVDHKHGPSFAIYAEKR
jgi:hypothetical protein